jgi:uncharacterized protein YkwD
VFNGTTRKPHRLRLTLIFTLLFGLVAFFAVATPAQAQQQVADPGDSRSQRLFLPTISNGLPAVSNNGSTSCNVTAEEMAAANLFLNDVHQSRSSVVCNPLLADVARQRAADMANRGYFDHVNPDGVGPNSLIRSAGYRLPNYYDESPSGNNVESIAAGFATAEATWEGLINSPHHRSHVLAEEPFFAEQTEYGIGYYYDPNSYYHHYWVILTALPDSP